jgi:hypothetical protein
MKLIALRATHIALLRSWNPHADGCDRFDRVDNIERPADYRNAIWSRDNIVLLLDL